MPANPTLNTDLTCALEEQEAIYWSKLYDNRGTLKCYANSLSGSFSGAVPEIDILALNRVIGLGITHPILPQTLDEAIHFYQKVGAKRFFIQLSPQVLNPELREILTKKRFRHHNNWAKLVRSSEVQVPVVESHLEVVRLTPAMAREYGALICNSFEWADDRLIDWLGASVGKPGYMHFAALNEGKTVAAAALHCAGDYAAMAFAGTLPEYRGMGAQSLLLQRRILEARKNGCRYILSETAENRPERPVSSYRNMIRFGFEEAYLRENWIWEC